jgi:predicted metal-dependent peptidase
LCLGIKKGRENLKKKIERVNINKVGHDYHKDEQEKSNEKIEGSEMTCWNARRTNSSQSDTLKGKGEKEDEKWRRIGLEAYFHCKSIGRVPGIIEEIVNGLVYPKVPWNTALRRYLSDISKDAFNWYPPNRRFIHQGLYLPSLYSPALKIAVAIDTSGSISKKELVAFVSEINSIISSFPSYNILLIQCDCSIHSETRILTGEFLPSSLKIMGRGGTDFRPVFERLKDEEIKVLIYLTDGLGEYPCKAPHYPVLWVISKSSYSVKPPFGTSIYIEVD